MQGVRLSLQHAQEARVIVPCRVLGYRLPGTPIPHFRRA